MNANAILWPVALQILLTLCLFFPLSSRKKAAVRAGLVDPKKTALDNSAWPEDVVRVSNNIQNQFQLPILFYVVCFAFALSNTVSIAVIGLAWAFVVSRIAHSFVHIKTNYVPHRMRVFIIGFLVLLVMLILLMFNIL